MLDSLVSEHVRSDDKPILATALACHDAGISCGPSTEDGEKRPDGPWKMFQQQRPSREQIVQWFSPERRTGLGVFTGKVSGNLEVLDFDRWETWLAYEDLARASGVGELLDRMKAGYFERTPRGVHLPYRSPTIAGNLKLAQRADKKAVIETRGEGGYAIIAPSNATVHPSGKPYVLLQGSIATIPTITPEEREELFVLARTFNEIVKEERQESQRQERKHAGDRPGDLFNARATWNEILEPQGWREIYSRDGVPYWRRPGKERGISATTNFQGSDLLYVFSTSTPFESERGYSKFSAYALLYHAGDFQKAAAALVETGYGTNTGAARATGYENEHATSWPSLAEEALHGLAGDIVRAIGPYTEADPVATLLNVLTAFGNCINSSAHVRVQHDHHPARLDVVQVGDTSKGRKGTGWSTPRYLLSLCDLDWAKERIKSGLSSGEGLIYNVRNPRYAKVPIKEKGRFTGEYDEIRIDEGEDDKRLLVIEPEFASTLTVMSREGSTLSAILRQAWDDGNLSPLTKNSPIKATGAHISIIGHITKAELLARLDDTSKANGFANRFLWGLVRRSKELPEGAAVPEEILQPLAEQVVRVITFSRTVAEVRRDDQARELWAAVYHDLSEGKPGLLGAVLSRAEAQVLRLSLIYALLDCSQIIRVEHLRAALTVWEYCERSAVLIFGTRLGDPTADRILEALRNAGSRGMTENDIYELFGRHKSANERARALTLLQALGLAKSEPEETGGRPRTVWRAA